MSHKLPAGKPAAPVYKCRYDFEWLRVFTWRERIAILCRSNFRLQASFLTSSWMGRVQPVFVGGITVAKTPEQQAEISAREKAAAERLTSPPQIPNVNDR
jgi:hypothetical protein